ncbi:efflux transporter outer membrane subunit [Oryzomicrobium sp.]|uniref:efflux transporter outer membrane subunit n=1 Tax=Oryzomicrobium sp. TaxID=1911578 RepID=UPI002FE00032
MSRPPPAHPIPAVALLLLALAGCAAGPDFVRPAPPAQGGYTPGGDPTQTVAGDGRAQRFNAGSAVSREWWKEFASPEIDALVQAGLANSPSVAQAQAVLRQSQQNLRASRGVFYPEVDLGAGFARQQLSPLRQGLNTAPSIFNLYTLSAAVGYVVDLFGGERRQVEGLAAQAEAERAALQATYLSLAGNIVNTAVAEAAYRADIAAMERLIDLQRQQLELVETQAAAGLVGDAAVVTARSQLVASEAALPPLQQRRAAAADLLSILIGRAPADDIPAQPELADIHLPGELPVSLPARLARQRPDILVAEASLHVASAQVGVATAALFPTLTLTGDYGVNNQRLGELHDPNSRFWSVGPTLTLPLFQGGSGVARKAAAVAGYDAALAAYRQTVLTALAQVADTLQALEHDAQVAAARRQALDLAQAQAELVTANRDAGLASDIDWLAARQQVEQARMGLNDATAQRHQDTVALYVALGGGWRSAPCETPADPSGSGTPPCPAPDPAGSASAEEKTP